MAPCTYSLEKRTEGQCLQIIVQGFISFYTFSQINHVILPVDLENYSYKQNALLHIRCFELALIWPFIIFWNCTC